MRTHRHTLAALALLAAFAVGLLQLLGQRFAAGDVYPAYSSLRADPVGTKALHDGLVGLPGLTVARHYRPAERLTGLPATVLFLGLPASWPLLQGPGTLKPYEQLAAAGHRVVLALLPAGVGAVRQQREEIADEQKRKPPARPPTKGPTWSSAELERKWGVRFATLPDSTDDEDEEATSGGLPRRSRQYLEAAATAGWVPLLGRDGRLLAAERPWGKGALVLVTDPFFLSNEGLLSERNAPLLTRLLGRTARVIFDEHHLGVQEEGSVGALARRYRLHGVVAVLLAIAALFLWRAGTSFLPAPPQPIVAVPLAGRDAAEGFVNLLRRHVPPARLLEACQAEWQRSLRTGLPVPEARRVDASAALERPEHRRDPVAGYRAVARALRRVESSLGGRGEKAHQ